VKRSKTGAVLYVRVSTEEQANGAQNLSNQEQRCRAFCKQEGLPVLEVFVDPGESGRSADRPEFQKMLAFCKKHQREIRSLVVQDLSRLARNLQDQIQTMSDLMCLGISVRSTYESNIDETAAGMLSANIFGTFNQYHSDALSEKMRGRTLQAVASGRFPWRAPVATSTLAERMAQTSSLIKNARHTYGGPLSSWQPDGTRRARFSRS
jgi:site-specific DNA recombinase